MTRDELEKSVAVLARCNRQGSLSDLGLIDGIMILVDEYAPDSVTVQAQRREVLRASRATADS